MWCVRRGLMVVGVVALAGPGLVAEAASAATTVRVSVASSGAQGNEPSVFDALSRKGRFVLFDSWASNLVSGDTNSVRDVFVRDRELGVTTRVSAGPDGRQANRYSHGVAISSDGRFVLFVSGATNLVNLPDRNRNVDVFVRDRLRAKTFRVSVRPRGGQFSGSSPRGQQLLTAGGISDNGRWVAFSQVVWPMPDYPRQGIRTFVRDRVKHTTSRVITTSGAFGERPAALSGDGRWLTVMLLDDKGPNVTDYVVHDRRSGRNTTVKTDLLHLYFGSAITPDARFLLTSWWNDVAGYQLVRWNRAANRTVLLLTNPKSGAYYPAGISADGRYVAFVTSQPDLVPNDTNTAKDLFRLDTETKTVIRLSVTHSGAQLIRGVTRPAWQANAGFLSADGRWAAFTTAGGRAVPNDTNHVADVFLRGPLN